MYQLHIYPNTYRGEGFILALCLGLAAFIGVKACEPEPAKQVCPPCVQQEPEECGYSGQVGVPKHGLGYAGEDYTYYPWPYHPTYSDGGQSGETDTRPSVFASRRVE